MDKSGMSCPECKTPMSLRLGIYECPGCGHTQAAAAKQTRQPRSAGFAGRREPWQSDRDEGYTVLRQKPGQFGGSLGHAERQSSVPLMVGKRGVHAEEDNSKARSLGFEKLMFFLIWIFASLGGGYYLFDLLNTTNFMTDLKTHECIYISIFVVFVLIGVMWFTLYYDECWVKWGMIVLSALILLIVAVFWFLVLTSSANLGRINFNAGGVGLAGAVLSVLLQLAWAGWLISILYRDIQRIQGR